MNSFNDTEDIQICRSLTHQMLDKIVGGDGAVRNIDQHQLKIQIHVVNISHLTTNTIPFPKRQRKYCDNVLL